MLSHYSISLYQIPKSNRIKGRKIFFAIKNIVVTNTVIGAG